MSEDVFAPPRLPTPAAYTVLMAPDGAVTVEFADITLTARTLQDAYFAARTAMRRSALIVIQNQRGELPPEIAVVVDIEKVKIAVETWRAVVDNLERRLNAAPVEAS